MLCFSPVGSTLRVRGRKFPAVVNCTQIDWFHEWPEEALKSVSLTFLRVNFSLYALLEVIASICIQLLTKRSFKAISSALLSVILYSFGGEVTFSNHIPAKLEFN